MENKKLEQYVVENYPKVYEEYIRYLNRENLPKVGEKVITLRSGFGGWGGEIRTVKEMRDGEIIITDGERDYISKIQDWYKDIVVIS